ncbi:MAG: 8-amino-7-oxononanoate synthase [Kiritimatiellaeota bacterium]|nr:8-amino-7-oxononanoate synthase [Kiritimatiellota bacterium]
MKRSLRGVCSISARECRVEGVDSPCLDFSSNNYLGIADHPKLKEEAIGWIRRFGTSFKASRLVSGTNPAHLELEELIADWKGSEAALLLGSGYMANTGLIPALAGRKDAIFADKLNHASLNAGAALSGAKHIRYRHNDLCDLRGKFATFNENRLVKKGGGDYGSEGGLVIISDSVFSMDGDIADIAGLAELAAAGNAALYIDDAHSTGVFGEKGEGLAKPGDADVVMGTFSKGMGAYGAYAACSKTLRDYFVNKCGSFIYSTAPPPGVCGAVSAAVRLVQTPEFREIRGRLLELAAWFAREVAALGFDTGKTGTPIVPVIIGDAAKTVRFSRYLLDNGVLAVAIRPPTVPVGSARLRLSLNAEHTKEDLSKVLELLESGAEKVLSA